MISKKNIVLCVVVVFLPLFLNKVASAQNTLGSSLFKTSHPQKNQIEDKRVILEAAELVYNKDTDTISAYDHVELSYQGRVLRADRVSYDQKKERVFALGNVRLVEGDGSVVTADKLELTGDFKDGFIESLRLEKVTPEGIRTRFSSSRAERVDGQQTVLEKGTYTPCNTCKKNPEKVPFWQIKAARIIHDGKEQTIYFEDARLEVWGVPVAYTPYFWTPDPSVNRKSGFLTPSYSQSSSRGFGITIPYFWALGPNYDLTLSPTYYSRQGFLGQTEWRHRIETGSYSVRATGLRPKDPDAYAKGLNGAGEREFRGSLETEGEFYINPRWRWGWNATLMTDRWFFENYGITGKGQTDIFHQEVLSTVYLKGRGERSYFDLSAYEFQGLSVYDWRAQQPVVLPVLDYSKRYAAPAFIGGEFQTDVNVTRLSRDAAHFKQLPSAHERFLWIYDTCSTFNPSACMLKGVAGTVTRASINQSWQREFIDPAGQVWKPFAFGRADAYRFSQNMTGDQNAYQNNVAGAMEDSALRGMVGAGIEYRYPLVARFGPSGSQLFEPIAQMIVRTDEQKIGELPNEDAQQVSFDDTNLFEWDKFSGYDRIEGGVRANLGAQYTLKVQSGARFHVLAGRSFHLAGINSFADTRARIGLSSGLDTDQSDYVGRVHFAPNKNLSFLVRGRLDNELDLKRFEAGTNFSFSKLPVNGSIFYTQYQAQPEIGQGLRREGVFASLNWKVNTHWKLSGSALVDLNFQPETYVTNGNRRTTQYWNDSKITARSFSVGFGYDDECIAFNFKYATSPKVSAEANGKNERDQIISFNLEFKTLGPLNASHNLTSN